MMKQGLQENRNQFIKVILIKTAGIYYAKYKRKLLL